MRIAVTGRTGQLAQALTERAAGLGISAIAIGRPEMDLAYPETVAAALIGLRPDIVVNAAAYTAVDLAESEPDLAYQVNAQGAEAVARAAAGLAIPVIQISTDYVFDGRLERAYREDDPARPIGIYGASKLRGERAVADVTGDHVILRTAWLYGPFGKNFVRTMLAAARERDTVSVVGDRFGTPTHALDLADGIIAIARNLLDRPAASELRGTFHITGAGHTNWAEFASTMFAMSAAAGGPAARVIPIATSDYPAAARRPANSRLDNDRLAAIHGVRLPDWRQSLEECVGRLLESGR